MSARVLIAGGGIGALAAGARAARARAAGARADAARPRPRARARARDRGRGDGRPARRRYELAAIADDLGAKLVADVLEAVDADRRMAGTRDSGLLGYDALLVAVGARPGPVPPGALRFAGARDAGALRGALDSLGERPRVLFTTGAGRRLDAAALRARAARRRPPSGRVDRRRDARAAARRRVRPRREPRGRAPARRGGRRAARRATCPRPSRTAGCGSPRAARCPPTSSSRSPSRPARRSPGCPSDPHGFLPVDRFGRVHGAAGVWAAGDATARPLKQGGLAAQQAEVAARSIAAALGAPVEPVAVRARPARRAAHRRCPALPAPLRRLDRAQRGQRAAAVVGARQDRRRARRALPGRPRAFRVVAAG